jgi:hypothetical protein
MTTLMSPIFEPDFDHPLIDALGQTGTTFALALPYKAEWLAWLPRAATPAPGSANWQIPSHGKSTKHDDTNPSQDVVVTNNARNDDIECESPQDSQAGHCKQEHHRGISLRKTPKRVSWYDGFRDVVSTVLAA